MLKTSSLFLIVLLLLTLPGFGQTKTRLAVVGLDHDHVWGILKDIAPVPDAELVAIADPHPDLIHKAKGRVSRSVKFYSDYIKMLDEVRPQAVIITTETDHHLLIVRECARRHIDVEMEKPMATTAESARQIARLARAAHIKLMVNYVNNWFPSTQELYQGVHSGKIGPVQKLIVQFGHQGPREIGVSKQFAAWLYDPLRNGGGALMDFGCYGADLAVWLEGRPTKVFARALKLKTSQHNAVEDDAVILLEYPHATAILEASWDWPYTKERAEVFGPKGSLLALPDSLLYRAAGAPASFEDLNGLPVKLDRLPLNRANPIAYFVDCIRNNKPVEGLLSPHLNVEVNEILDAAKQSIKTGRAVIMPAE